MNRTPEDFLLKVIVVGDSAVGKTKLLARFADNSYNTSYVSTIGVDFKVQTILLDDKKVKFQIWDTAGQERYRTIAQTYYKGASGVVLVYSVTDPNSLAHIGTPFEASRQLGGADPRQRASRHKDVPSRQQDGR